MVKQLYLVVVLVVGFSLCSYAQECGVDSVPIAAQPDFPTVLYPVPDSLPCMVVGQPVSDTLYFTNYTMFRGFTVVSVTIDSINNLPAGLCWATNVTGNTFAAGQNGAISIQGIPYDLPGQYKLAIYLQVATTVTQLPNFNLEQSTQYRYYMRLSCPAGACPPIDSSGGVDSSFILYPQFCNNGIHEAANSLSDISVVPNPLSGAASVSFSSSVEGKYSMQLVNMMGEAVTAQDVNVKNGNNECRLDATGLASGIYILYLSDGRGTATKKVVIE